MRTALQRAGHLQAWVLTLVTTAVYTLVSVLQWRSYEAPSWDLAIFTQLAKAYAHLEAPIVPIKGAGFNLLGDHFHPVLVLLGPVYRVFPSGLTLLVVQAVLLGVSVWPITRLARAWLGRWPGAGVGVAYAFSFGLQGAVRTQFHEIAFAVPLLAFGLVALVEGRFPRAAWWLAPLVFVKEDLGLMVALLGVVMAWRGARRAGGLLAGWGIVAFLLTTMIVLPALNPSGRWDYTDNLNLGDAVSGPLQAMVALLGPGEKIVTLILLTLVAGVVGLRSGIVLAMLPTLAWRFAGDVSFYWGWQWHYDAVLMPIAILALLDVLGPREQRETEVAHEPSAPGRAQGRMRGRWVPLALGAACLPLVLTAAHSPVVDLLDAETYRRPPRADSAADIVTMIPEGAVVASDVSLLAHLVPTTTTLWSGTSDNPIAEFVVLDRRGATWNGNPPDDVVSWAEETYPGAAYEIVFDADGYEVAQLLEASDR